ncbi:phage antirepressor [Bifidobacterium crudilactis]|jgi:anti-repressor protein|uniref:phage antirepressor n=1 Tax=Bifidobacterium crudilactis TaxID=327277 RepID=UPI002353679A|nr:phage antirepressor [Bifidobacterium crudilactis]MCI2158471.1 phage antirepressor [Bifidobacterium crudilactis]
MTSIQPFDFKGTPVRTITYETGLTWWVLKDVCDALNLSNPTMIAQRLDDDEQSKIDPKSGLGSVSNTPVNIVNEAGLYKIILRSDKPEAKEFQRWVTHEVLPSIRKHGGYMAGQESMTPEQMALASMQWLHSKVEEQARQLEAQAPKVLFADAVNASQTSILVGQLAKIIQQNGVPMGQRRLFAWLRERHYLSSRKGEDYNMPLQKYIEQGLFEIKESTHTNPDGVTFTTRTVKVTGKGQQYFVNKFLGNKGIEKAA